VRLRAPEPPGSFRAAGLHLGVLSAFAFAQPLFDLLGRNAPFFAVRGSTRWDVLVFAFGLVVLPPLLLLALEALAGLAYRTAASALHLVFLAGLTGLVCLQALREIDGPDSILVAAAGLAGIAAAVLYTRVRAAQALLTVLGLAPLLFLALFLLVSPVSRLVTGSAPAPRLAEVGSRTPVVLVVFDELPTVSLMDEHERIDPVRYPNFARLAADGIWFRNATTVHEWTTWAVPSILTGLHPERDALPLYLDHPNNLFTLLGGSYDLRVVESQAHLCPAELCGAEEGLGGRLRSILSDVGVVYPHLVLPDGLRARLTPLGDAWSGFRHAGGRPAVYLNRDAEVRRFVETITPGREPGLYFLHVLLPHHPWEYLPDGKRYSSALPWQPGLVDDRWTGDPELAIQAQQRHLLQVGFTDRLLGDILGRLREQGLYDDALVIVTADHGSSFRASGERRRANSGNLEDIAFVPLLVKLPHERAGRIEDAHVQTVDVVPTIADVLGVRIPWRTDGRSALAVRSGEEPQVSVFTSSGERVTADAADLARRREDALDLKLELFGTDLFRIGPHRELLGREVDGLASLRDGGPEVRLLGGTFYHPDAPVVPVHVAGILLGADDGEDIAVAVEGRIEAVTHSYRYAGKTWFSAVLPEDAFRQGPNTVRVFVVETEGSSVRLVEAPPNVS
jgi:Sulfatase